MNADELPELHDAHVKAWRERAAQPRAPFVRFGPYRDGTFEEMDLLTAVLQTDSQKHRLLVREAQQRAEEERQRRAASAKGVEARRAKLEQNRIRFSAQVQACQDRGEETGDYIKKWAGEYHVDDDTIRNWLKAVTPK